MDLGLLAHVECRMAMVLEIKVEAVVVVVLERMAGMEVAHIFVAHMQAVAEIGAAEQVDSLLHIQIYMADPGVPA
jgi:hypothetical protein